MCITFRRKRKNERKNKRQKRKQEKEAKRKKAKTEKEKREKKIKYPALKIKKIQAWINNYPREIFNFLCANDVFKVFSTVTL